MPFFLQIADPVSSVERIGFWATVGLIILILIVWGVKQLFKYFTSRLDKKDQLLVDQQREGSATQLKLIDDRRTDLLRLEKILDDQSKAIKDQTDASRAVVAGLQALADEMKRNKRR